MAEAVTPLYKKPYEEQLDMKMSAMREFLKRAASVVQHPDSNPVSMLTSVCPAADSRRGHGDALRKIQIWSRGRTNTRLVN